MPAARQARWMLTLSLLALTLAAPLSTALPPPSFEEGDVFVGVHNVGTRWYRGNTLMGTLTSASGNPSPLNAAFDVAGNAYVGFYNTPRVERWDNHGARLGVFATLPNSAGNIIVDENHQVWIGIYGGQGFRKYSLDGTLLATFPAGTGGSGSFLALAPDGCTMYHTAWTTAIYRRDVCTPGAPDVVFAPKQVAQHYSLAMMPEGEGLLLATSNGVLRFNAAGAMVQQYRNASNPNNFGVSVNPDGESFTTSNSNNGRVLVWDIDSGAALPPPVLAVAGATSFGIAVFGGSAGPTDPVPEMTTIGLLGAGVALLVVAFRRRG